MFAGIAGCAGIVALCLSSAPGIDTAGGEKLLVVLNKSDSTVSILERATGRSLATLPTGEAPHEVAVCAARGLAVISNYGGRRPGSSLTVVDLAGRRVLRAVDLREYRRPHGVRFLRDGRRVVVTAEENRAVLVVDVDGGKVLQAVGTGQEVSHMIALAPGERTAFVANIGSGSVSILDLEGGKLEKVLPTGGGAEGIAVSPDGREVWVANRAADTVSVIDAAARRVVATLESKGFPIRVCFTPGGKRVLVSNARAGSVAVFSAATRELERSIPMALTAKEKEGRLIRFGASPVPIGIVVSPDGRRAYVANTTADIISVIDLERFEVVARYTAGREPDGMAVVDLPVNGSRPGRAR